MEYITIETTVFPLKFLDPSSEEIFNTNIEVSVAIKKDNSTLSVIAETTANLNYLMEKDKTKALKQNLDLNGLKFMNTLSNTI